MGLNCCPYTNMTWGILVLRHCKHSKTYHNITNLCDWFKTHLNLMIHRSLLWFSFCDGILDGSWVAWVTTKYDSYIFCWGPHKFIHRKDEFESFFLVPDNYTMWWYHRYMWWGLTLKYMGYKQKYSLISMYCIYKSYETQNILNFSLIWYQYSL